MTSVLITGSTDGIGLATAKQLVSEGHDVILHGRNAEKLAGTVESIAEQGSTGNLKHYVADLSRAVDVASFADDVLDQLDTLDVLINNAGVFNAADPVTADGLDVRFAVNTIAPYLLTNRLLPLIGQSGRVINLSSAAQAPVDLDALAGQGQLPARAAYAQSKLALTMWSNHLASELDDGPMVVAVNPGSLLGTKMVKDAFNMDGKDIGIGADILVRAATSDEFADAGGKYYDNDSARFGPPHPDALDQHKNAVVTEAIEAATQRALSS